MPNTIETLLDDERKVLEKYRYAKTLKHSTLSIDLHVQDGRLVHLNFHFTEKYRPDNGTVRLREQVA